MTEIVNLEAPSDEESAAEAPSITADRLEFSDGTSISLNADDIVVFVGPNNAGKSAALREIEAALCASSEPKYVIRHTNFKQVGNLKSADQYISNNSYEKYQNGQKHYTGNGYNIAAQSIGHFWNNNTKGLAGFFCKRLKTETRITDSNPTSSHNVLSEAATRPIQMLYTDSDIEKRISDLFKAAFSKDLIVMKGGGNEIPLLVGERLPLELGEDPTTRKYIERLMQQASPLKDQGDGMRSFASVILEMLASQAPTMLLLDEPEAFLHPPQARLLGEFLARSRQAHAQMFISTHSPEVLQGLLSEAPRQLRVIRLHREGDVNRVCELRNEKAQEISTDPLMKYSAVLSAVFHQRAIICESDADCMFYNAILSQSSVNGGSSPDALFLHASGKHRIAPLAEALRALGVPVDVVADIDVINDERTFKKLVEAMGGDWGQAHSDWKAVRDAIVKRKVWVNAETVKQSIIESLEKLESEEEFPKALANEIQMTLKKSSPWEAVKKAGDAAIPNGQPTRQMKSLRNYLEPLGIWIVPVGEIEGFCPAVDGHGPKWAQAVLEQFELNESPELDSARAFIREIWNREAKLNASNIANSTPSALPRLH